MQLAALLLRYVFNRAQSVGWVEQRETQQYAAWIVHSQAYGNLKERNTPRPNGHPS